MRALLEHNANIHSRNSQGKTPLHYSSILGHTAITRVLLQHGADINAQSDSGDTALHFACQGCIFSIFAHYSNILGFKVS